MNEATNQWNGKLSKILLKVLDMSLIKAHHMQLQFFWDWIFGPKIAANVTVWSAPPLRVPSPLPLPLCTYSNVFYAHFFMNSTLCFTVRGLC